MVWQPHVSQRSRACREAVLYLSIKQLVWETLFSSGCLNSKLWTLLQDFIDLQSKTPTTPEESVAASIGGRHAGGAVVVCRSEVVRERG
ncbi:hypothetical protein vseg_011089 [Gypsophila vaccaria]